MSKDGVDGLSDFERKCTVMSVLMSTLIDTFSISIQYPIIPFIAERVGATKSQQGIVFSLFPFGKIFGQAALGYMADTLGRKPAVVICLVATSFACLFFASANSPNQLMAAGLIAGLAGGTWPITRTVVIDVMPQEEIPRWMGIAATFMSVPYVLGPFVSGLLSRVSLQLPFYAVSATSAVVAFLTLLFMIETKTPTKAAVAGAKNPLLTLACTMHSSGQAIISVLCVFFQSGIQVGYLSSFTPLIVEVFAWDVTVTTNVFAFFCLTYLVASTITSAQNTAYRMGFLNAIIVGCLLMILSHLLSGFLKPPIDQFWGGPLLAILMTSWSTGKVIADPAFFGCSSDAVPKEVQGTFMGITSAFGSLGGVILTWLYHHLSDNGGSYRTTCYNMAFWAVTPELLFMMATYFAREYKLKTAYDPARLLM